jgi:hypothetical protein
MHTRTLLQVHVFCFACLHVPKNTGNIYFNGVHMKCQTHSSRFFIVYFMWYKIIANANSLLLQSQSLCTEHVITAIPAGNNQ